MSKPVLKDLPELLHAGIISQDTADKIQAYYATKTPSHNRLMAIFGVLGALLTGLGVILIIAHNWDDFSRAVKLLFAFIPLGLGQLVCGYIFFKKINPAAWREAAATFLFFSIAASISIVSQVYHVEGSLSGFLWIWMLLAFPVAYLMRSSMVSLLFIGGITWYACEISYFQYPNATGYWYWAFLAGIIPFYYTFIKNKIYSNAFHFHSWFIALSITIAFGMFGERTEEWLYIGYISLFCGFIVWGEMEHTFHQKLITNAFLVTGSLGLVIVFLILSFEWFWKDFYGDNTVRSFQSPEFVASLVVTILVTILLLVNLKRQSYRHINPKVYLYVVGPILLGVGYTLPVLAQIITNVVIFVTAIITIRRGAQEDRLVIMNYGLLIIAALITCRFFDTDIPFVFRGLLFVAVGLGFFLLNYYMLKRKNNQALNQ